MTRTQKIRVKNTIREFKTVIKIKSSPLRHLLKKNEQLRNSKVNCRCFILGNGPSLNLYDLKKLRDEDVFCVNEFVRYPLVDMIKPQYYFLADPKFFDMNPQNEGDLYLINKIKSYGEQNGEVKMFVPVEACDSVKRYGWNHIFDTFFYYPRYEFYAEYRKKIEFSEAIPGMQAVVQYAILMAIYMGYKEIYLLGTDQTNIFGNIRAFLDENIASDYAFEMNEEEKRWKNKKLTDYSLQETLRGYAKIFELYDELAQYCSNKGIGIYNCAPETLIQGIKKKDFDELF